MDFLCGVIRAIPILLDSQFEPHENLEWRLRYEPSNPHRLVFLWCPLVLVARSKRAIAAVSTSSSDNSENSSWMSTPTELRPSSCAATQVVPEPTNGSKTQSPESVK